MTVTNQNYLEIKTILKRISEAESTTTDDDRIMETVLTLLQIKGRVTGGFVFIFPYNTQPISIQQFAKVVNQNL